MKKTKQQEWKETAVNRPQFMLGGTFRVGFIDDEGNLRITKKLKFLKPGAALKFAQWINETFSDDELEQDQEEE